MKKANEADASPNTEEVLRRMLSTPPTPHKPPKPKKAKPKGVLNMSFIQRELDRIAVALRDPAQSSNYDLLYAAQQALSWATEPYGFKSPYYLITNTQEDSAGCLENTHQPLSSNIFDLGESQQQRLRADH